MVITTIVDGVYKPTSITGGYHLLWWNFEKLVMPIRATRGCWNHGTCAVVYNYMWVFADISFTVPQDIIDCHSTWSYLRRYVRVTLGWGAVGVRWGWDVNVHVHVHTSLTRDRSGVGGGGWGGSKIRLHFLHGRFCIFLLFYPWFSCCPKGWDTKKIFCHFLFASLKNVEILLTRDNTLSVWCPLEDFMRTSSLLILLKVAAVSLPPLLGA